MHFRWQVLFFVYKNYWRWEGAYSSTGFDVEEAVGLTNFDEAKKLCLFANALTDIMGTKEGGQLCLISVKT